MTLLEVRYTESRRVQFDWTDERIAELTRMWVEEEMSYADIAAVFGITRNAVTGKVDRLGLTGRACDVDNRSKGAERREARKRLAAGRLHNPTRILAKRAKSDPGLPAVPFEAALAMPAIAPCALLDLDDTKCHWPFGEPQSQAFHFCGGPAKGPYCAGHHSIAYRRVG